MGSSALPSVARMNLAFAVAGGVRRRPRVSVTLPRAQVAMRITYLLVPLAVVAEFVTYRPIMEVV